jgi:superfamily II DNA or RNA helicase
MSRQVKISSLSDKQREKITKDLKIRQEPSRYAFGAQATYIYPFCIENDYVYVPFAYGKKFPRPERRDFTQCRVKFHGELREEQKSIEGEAISSLNKTGSSLVAVYTGCGKTVCAIKMATKMRMKTLVICHRIVLINQWKRSIEKFCPDATIQILDSTCAMGECDFYIVNATNVPKRPRGFFRDMGVVIVDECHLIMAEGLSKSMLHLTPRYVLGLSATPYRPDGLNVLLDLYFGKRKIERKLWHKHKVWKIMSGFTPQVELAKNGKINWSVIINSQAEDEQRNEMIIRLIQYYPERCFLVLTKRVAQARYLVSRLQQVGEDVTSLIGKQQTYDKDSRILVGTNSKAGVGFDHPRLDSLILAADLEQYFIQYLGRIFRRKDVEPLIFDIVDNNPILLKHFRTRQEVYIEHGGLIHDFNRKHPEFRLR